MLDEELLVEVAVGFAAVLGSVCVIVAAWKLVLAWSHQRADRTWSIDKLACTEAGEVVSVEQPMHDSPKVPPKFPPKEEVKECTADLDDAESVVDLDDDVFDLDEAAPAEDKSNSRKKVVSFLV